MEEFEEFSVRPADNSATKIMRPLQNYARSNIKRVTDIVVIIRSPLSVSRFLSLFTDPIPFSVPRVTRFLLQNLMKISMRHRIFRIHLVESHRSDSHWRNALHREQQSKFGVEIRYQKCTKGFAQKRSSNISLRLIPECHSCLMDDFISENS